MSRPPLSARCRAIQALADVVEQLAVADDLWTARRLMPVLVDLLEQEVAATRGASPGAPSDDADHDDRRSHNVLDLTAFRTRKGR